MNKSERWKAVEELFHRTLEIPETERTAFLEAHSGGDTEMIREVRSLIDSDVAASTGSFAAAAVKKALVSFHKVETDASAPGRKIGPYRLLHELGRGGMGTVYLATRDDDTFKKSVAIKLVRRGMDTDFILARFRRERQILASLEHPNIARLIDGGATDDGLPYLVMEYVKGVSICEYAIKHALAVDQRLRIFLQICDAVAYAHRNFIVHRDLKPSNILVDENGVPKLLDFGISKLLVYDGTAITETITQDVRMLTPDYASPEQVRGEPITAAADVYSLGAVLYELLTGVKPHRIDGPTPQAVERAICEIDVQKPSEAVRAAGDAILARRLEGDIDNIVMLAMRKETQRRYPSVQDLAADIRAHLEYHPVSARPDDLVYRSKKYLRRNWGPLAAVTAVILVLLIGVLMARREARIARTHFDQVRRLANTFVTTVHDEIRDLPGSTRARSMIVKTGLEYLETLAANAHGDIDLQRELGAGYRRIGDVQGSVMEANLGDTKGALESYTKALKLLENVARERPGALDVRKDILNIYRRVGDIYGYTKSNDAALRAYAHARAVGEPLLAQRPDDLGLVRSVAELYQAQALSLRLGEDLNGALDASNRATELYRQVAAKRPDDFLVRREVASAVSAAGMALGRLGRREDALRSFTEAVGELEWLVARNPQNASSRRGLMLAYSHVGDTLSEPGVATPAEAPAALQAYLKMYGVAQKLHHDDPANFRALSDIGIATMRVARVTADPEQKLQRFTEALGYLQKAAQINKDLMLDMNTAFIETRIAELLRAKGAKDSLRYYQRALQANERLLANDPKNQSVRRTLMEDLRALGEDNAKRGVALQAEIYRDRILELAEQVKSLNVSNRMQGQIPRGYASAGFIEVLLGNKKSARDLFERALTEHRRLQALPGYAGRDDLAELEGAINKLR